MNLAVPLTFVNKYDFIFDGGTIEHVFNMPQVMSNIIDMLQVDGVFCSITCNNNFSGHGFYQFSPEFFQRTLAHKYGMEIKELYIGENNTDMSKWINVKELSSDCSRNTQRYYSNEEVYIITIAKKLSNDRIRLLNEAPQQFNYENVDWTT
jgi:2-polyprenyl-3-methyl-5-hydroxy-6-metoxy-1,4-benzoquinol methylase